MAYRKVGDIQGHPKKGNIGDSKAALESLREIRSAARTVAGGLSRRSSPRVLLLARTYTQQAMTLIYTQGIDAAEQSARKALTLAEAHQQGAANEFERAKLLADAHWTRMVVASTTGKGVGSRKPRRRWLRSPRRTRA